MVSIPQMKKQTSCGFRQVASKTCHAPYPNDSHLTVSMSLCGPLLLQMGLTCMTSKILWKRRSVTPRARSSKELQLPPCSFSLGRLALGRADCGEAHNGDQLRPPATACEPSWKRVLQPQSSLPMTAASRGTWSTATQPSHS